MSNLDVKHFEIHVVLEASVSTCFNLVYRMDSGQNYAVFHPTVFQIIESAIFVGIIQENGGDLGNIHLWLKADGKQRVLMKKTPREIVF